MDGKSQVLFFSVNRENSIFLQISSRFSINFLFPFSLQSLQLLVSSKLKINLGEFEEVVQLTVQALQLRILKRLLIEDAVSRAPKNTILNCKALGKKLPIIETPCLAPRTGGIRCHFILAERSGAPS